MRSLSILLLLSFVACGGEDAPTGLGEPLVLSGPQVAFKSGPLVSAAETAPLPLPRVTAVETQRAIFFPGASERPLSGRATPDAVAVALQVKGLGSGHWVLPVGVPDPTANNELTWEFELAFDKGVKPGQQTLLLAAVDATGKVGPASEFAICVASVVPDNLNACEPSIAPPDTVLSLSWDTGMDLDLVVTTPEGKQVDANHPSTGKTGSVGQLQTDAQRTCESAGLRREDLVWQQPPQPGAYLVRVNTFDACHFAVAHFTATLHRAVEQPDGTRRLAVIWQQSGTLLPVSANGGSTPGLFLNTLSF